MQLLIYVNIYSVGRSYGGPEEGGWYFDTGSPVGAIPVELTDEERKLTHAKYVAMHGNPDHIDPELYAEHFREVLHEKARAIRDEYVELYPDTGKSSSVLGGDDYRVVIEDHFAKPYPEEYPRYE